MGAPGGFWELGFPLLDQLRICKASLKEHLSTEMAQEMQRDIRSVWRHIRSAVMDHIFGIRDVSLAWINPESNGELLQIHAQVCPNEGRWRYVSRNFEW